MTIHDLLETFRTLGPAPAITGDRGDVTYARLAENARTWHDRRPLPEGSVVAMVDEFNPDSAARLLSLWARNCIVVPISTTTNQARPVAVAQAEYVIRNGEVRRTGSRASHPLYDALRARRSPGLVLFTSGTTSMPKGVVHDLGTMLRKVARPGRTHRTLGFLGFDHIGGQNTFLYCLAHGGCLVSTADRSPDRVCAAIEANRVELLPTTPTFLRLLLLNRAYERYDLSSLKLITYGSEPMPENTLNVLNEVLPNVDKLQQYGMSELGVLRSRSRGDDSNWLKLGGPEFEVRVVEGRLEVRAETAMLGYLNAPSPFTEDGWLQTGDVAEMDGEWIRVLGRRSEVINVGGEKVHPAEVESVLESMPGVAFATVHGEPNPLVGNVVVARVQLMDRETPTEFRRRMRAFCADRIPRHMVPQRIEFVTAQSVGFKKQRAA
ncbi:MAG: ANL family adenylate-forming protein [Fimbriimonas sp.]